MSNLKLGVNIDHIAVLREARGVNDPDILNALSILKCSKASQITIHLREDRRHINEMDAKNICHFSPLPVNLECCLDEEILNIICRLKPQRATLVPENREEVTTERGLDVDKLSFSCQKAITQLHANEIEVSLFIEPNTKQIQKSFEVGTDAVEFHTGHYANLYNTIFLGLGRTPHAIKALKTSKATLKRELEKELEKIQKATQTAKSLGFFVAAGHGLNYQNVQPIVQINGIKELNIGQSIIARSVFTGLKKAIDEMVVLLNR